MVGPKNSWGQSVILVRKCHDTWGMLLKSKSHIKQLKIHVRTVKLIQNSNKIKKKGKEKAEDSLGDYLFKIQLDQIARAHNNAIYGQLLSCSNSIKKGCTTNEEFEDYLIYNWKRNRCQINNLCTFCFY